MQYIKVIYCTLMHVQRNILYLNGVGGAHEAPPALNSVVLLKDH